MLGVLLLVATGEHVRDGPVDFDGCSRAGDVRALSGQEAGDVCWPAGASRRANCDGRQQEFLRSDEQELDRPVEVDRCGQAGSVQASVGNTCIGPASQLETTIQLWRRYTVRRRRLHAGDDEKTQATDVQGATPSARAPAGELQEGTVPAIIHSSKSPTRHGCQANGTLDSSNISSCTKDAVFDSSQYLLAHGPPSPLYVQRRMVQLARERYERALASAERLHPGKTVTFPMTFPMMTFAGFEKARSWEAGGGFYFIAPRGGKKEMRQQGDAALDEAMDETDLLEY